MSRSVSFSIDGDPSKGIDAFKRLQAAGEATAKALQEAMASVSSMMRDMTSITQAMRGLREGAVATSRAVRSMSSNLSGIGARSREVTAALKAQAGEVNKATAALVKQRNEVAHVARLVGNTAKQTTMLRAGFTAAAAQTATLRAGLLSSSAVLGRMLAQASLLANRLAYGARAASLQMRAGFAGSAQGLQGLGIGFRMSGIAVGNQLANLGTQGISGMIGNAVGAAAAGAEMAARLVASFAGTATRLLGPAVNAILVPIGAIVQGIGDLMGSGLTKALGGTVSLLTQAFGNVFSAVTNLVGEAVSQVGNIFTGVVEAARGAFQGAVNVASSLLGSLVGVAQDIVGRIGGVLGTLGKAVLGVGGTLAGFALTDAAKTEAGVMKGVVLLDNKLSPQEKRNLREWAEDLHRQMPTITRDALGETFQRVVSTGFSGDLAGAKKATEAALRLQFGAEGGGSPAEAARVMAKSFSVFREELEKFPDPLQRVSDLLFQTINAADVTLGDLVTHLGEVIGPAKALGLSLEDLLILIAKMSRTAGIEQTFTGLRRILIEPLKMSQDATSILAKYGISPTTLSPAEEQAIKEKQQAISKKTAELARLEANRKEAPAGRIKELKAEIKALKGELKDFEKTAGTVTDLKGFLDSLAKAGIGAKELAVVFPDIRALTAAMTLSSQDPRMAASIEAMIRGAGGKATQAVAEQAETIQVKLLQVWEGLKQPFHATLDAMEGPFKAFLDRIVGGLSNLTAWWKEAIGHPAAGRLLSDLSSKFGGLFKGLFGGLEGPSQGQFWRALTDGLDMAWSFGEKVVGVFKTLVGLIHDLVSGSEMLKSAWGGVKAAGAWVGDTFSQLSKGSTKNLTDAWSGARGAFETLWKGATAALKPVLDEAGRIFGAVISTAKEVGNAIVSAFNVVVSGLEAAIPLLAAYAAGGLLRGAGGLFAAPAAAGAPTLIAGGGGHVHGGMAGVATAGPTAGDVLTTPRGVTARDRFGFAKQRIGGALRGAGRWATGGSGAAILSLGGAMAGGAISESGSPVLGGAIQGAAYGALGFTTGNVLVGAVTTVVGAVVGALSGLARASESAAESLRAVAQARVLSITESLGGLSPTDQITRLSKARSAAGGMSAEWPAFSQQIVRIAREGTLDALQQAESGDLEGAVSSLSGLHRLQPQAVSGVLSARGTSFEQQIAAWQDAIQKATEATRLAALEEERKAAESKARLDAFLRPFEGLQTEIETVEDEVGTFRAKGFSGGFQSASDAARFFESEAAVLETWATNAAEGLKEVPPEAQETAAALRALTDAAFSTAALARETQAAAAAEAAAGAAKTPEQLMEEIPVLKGLLAGRLAASSPEKSLPVVGERAAEALDAVDEAADETAETMDELAAAVGEAAHAASEAAVRMVRFSSGGALPATSSVFPSAVPMTAAEARGKRRSMRHDAHLDRLRAGRQYDQFGNAINPFTGLPAVGEFGGVGWGVRLGGGDMGPSPFGTKRKGRDPYKGLEKRPDGGVVLSDGTIYYPYANDPETGGKAPWQAGATPSTKDGGMKPLADAAKDTAGKAGETASATKEATGAIKDTGKAMGEATSAAKQTTDTARKGVEVTRQKIGELHAADMALKSEIDALAAQVTSISADEAGN